MNKSEIFNAAVKLAVAEREKYFLVPMLPRGNRLIAGVASGIRGGASRTLQSHAGAWERANSFDPRPAAGFTPSS